MAQLNERKLKQMCGSDFVNGAAHWAQWAATARPVSTLDPQLIGPIPHRAHGDGPTASIDVVGTSIHTTCHMPSKGPSAYSEKLAFCSLQPAPAAIMMQPIWHDTIKPAKKRWLFLAMQLPTTPQWWSKRSGMEAHERC